jgi:hypothetical protein
MRAPIVTKDGKIRWCAGIKAGGIRTSELVKSNNKTANFLGCAFGLVHRHQARDDTDTKAGNNTAHNEGHP